MANKTRHTLHRKSNVNKDFTLRINNKNINVKNPKAPKPEDIEYGEIAINYGKGSESFFIKNAEGEIIRVNSLANIRYDGGEIDNSIKTYLDDKYINVSGDTIEGEFKVPNQNYPSVKGAPQYKKNDCLGKQIKVVGIKIGDYQTPNEKIPVGTPIEKILDNILCKTIGVEKHLPTVSISNSGTSNDTYEVGTKITPKLSHTYHDGSFEGAEELYIDESTNRRYKIASQCNEGTTTYYRGSNSIATASTATETYQLEEEDIKYKCTTTYGQSKAKPIDTKGNACTGDSAVINAGTATSTTITYYGRYKYFLGYINKTTNLSSSEVRSLTTKSSWVILDSSTTIVGSSAIKSNGNSIVIAVPNGYKLKTITNGLGADILGNFTKETVKVALQGGINKDYNVYIYPITNGARVEFKNVVIGK